MYLHLLNNKYTHLIKTNGSSFTLGTGLKFIFSDLDKILIDKRQLNKPKIKIKTRPSLRKLLLNVLCFALTYLWSLK